MNHEMTTYILLNGSCLQEHYSLSNFVLFLFVANAHV